LTEKFLAKVEWDLKMVSSYSNDQWLLCKEQTRFNMTSILHALMLNQNIIDEIILIILRNQSLKG
jgi:hypothetical protein